MNDEPVASLQLAAGAALLLWAAGAYDGCGRRPCESKVYAVPASGEVTCDPGAEASFVLRGGREYVVCACPADGGTR
jgi:hypothetical protein